MRRVTSLPSWPAARGLTLVAEPVTPDPPRRPRPAGATLSDQRAPQLPKRATAVGTRRRGDLGRPRRLPHRPRVLQRGGNAVDAAVATAAALGVTEPYSAGVGGRRLLRLLRRRDRQGRAPSTAARPPRGRSRATPSSTPTPASPTRSRPTWSPAASRSACPAPPPPGAPRCAAGAPARWPRSLEPQRPAGRARLRGRRRPSARRPSDNRERFEAFTTTKRPLPARRPAPAGRHPLPQPRPRPHLPRVRPRPAAVLPRRAAARDLDRRAPPTVAEAAPTCRCRPGYDDARRPRVATGPRSRRPPAPRYRGLEVVGMRRPPAAAPPSARRSTSSRATTCRRCPTPTPCTTTSRPARWPSPTAAPTSATPASSTCRSRSCSPSSYADERACRLDPDTAADQAGRGRRRRRLRRACADAHAHPADRRRGHTRTSRPPTSPSADRWGNVVSYTLTIEQTGGSGIVVPGRGFLLNNELTDFSLVYDADDPNRIQPGKRPRSSMSPTIVLRDGKPFLALGSPGGSTIITTVLQVLFNRLDRGHDAARGGRRAAGLAAQHRDRHRRAGVHRRLRRPCSTPYGHDLVPAGDAFTSAAEIGAAHRHRVRPGRAADGRRRARCGAAAARRGSCARYASRTVARAAVPWRGDEHPDRRHLDRDHRRRRSSSRLLGEPHRSGPATRAAPRCSTSTAQWLAASPFCVMATADADGQLRRLAQGRPGRQLVHVIDDTHDRDRRAARQQARRRLPQHPGQPPRRPELPDPRPRRHPAHQRPRPAGARRAVLRRDGRQGPPADAGRRRRHRGGLLPLRQGVPALGAVEARDLGPRRRRAAPRGDRRDRSSQRPAPRASSTTTTSPTTTPGGSTA